MTRINHTFSQTLSQWLSDRHKKTIGSMLSVFDEKSFAFIFLVLMIFPATPLPTGGITHVFEIIVILLASQILVGRKYLWLPKKLQRVELSKSTQRQILPFLLRRIQFIERFARPRFVQTLQTKWFRLQLGAVVALLALAAFLAPPFTGLDTLPSLGVVVIATGIILDDLFVVLAGYVVGILGILLEILLGAGIITAFFHFI